MVPNHKPPGFAGKHTPESYNIIQHGDEQQFETLRGYPGVVLEPMPWSLAQELIDQHTEDSLGQLGRHPLQLRTYMTFRDKVRFFVVCKGGGRLLFWQQTNWNTR